MRGPVYKIFTSGTIPRGSWRVLMCARERHQGVISMREGNDDSTHLALGDTTARREQPASAVASRRGGGSGTLITMAAGALPEARGSPAGRTRLVSARSTWSLTSPAPHH